MMNWKDLQNYLKKYKILACLIVSIGLIIAGIFIIQKQVTVSKEATPLVENVDIKEDEEMIFVDVKGAVKQPNVYQLSKGSRVIDAIQQAGGFLDNADRNKVNLSQVLTDEMEVVVYEKEVSQETTANNDGKVNLNTATKEELMTLNGVGSSKAEAILEYRHKNNRFKSIDDLKNISGISEKLIEKIRNYVIIK